MQKRMLLKAMALASLGALPALAMAAEQAAPAMRPSGCGCPPPPPPPCGCRCGGGHPGMGPHHFHHRPRGPRTAEDFDRISKHAAEKLNITDAQKPAFDEWMGVRKEMWEQRRGFFTQMKEAKDSQQRAELRAKEARARADSLERLATARGKLYQQLTPEQKKLFDRFEFGHGPKGRRPGGPRPKRAES